MKSDVDIDLADRDSILKYIDHVPAIMKVGNQVKRHTSGVYVTNIPKNPLTGYSSLQYDEAEERGYMKLDFLNLWVYKFVRDERHLVELMREPDWRKLLDRPFFEQLIHVANHYDTMIEMPEPVDSIPRLAMFLSIIRPGKKHLIGKSWSEISKSVWDKNSESGYVFKKSHAISYAQLVVVHMNLLSENSQATQSIHRE